MGLVYLPTFSWLIFTYFYGFHVGSIPFVPWMVWGPMFIRTCSRKNPKDETTYNSVVKGGATWIFPAIFSNKKTWGPCGVLGPSMLEDGPVIF